MDEVLNKVKELTSTDLDHKSIFALLAKLVEESGEFARELQIEEGVFGNTHKALDEGTIGESIDILVMGLVLYFARNRSKTNIKDLPDLLKKKLAKWESTQNREVL
jgi:NTP pyrophosphatase (non-canonical NTP hydrolase)